MLWNRPWVRNHLSLWKPVQIQKTSSIKSIKVKFLKEKKPKNQSTVKTYIPVNTVCLYFSVKWEERNVQVKAPLLSVKNEMQCNDNFLPPESSYCIVLTMLFKYLFMGPVINSHEVKIPSYLYSLLFFVPCSTCNSHRVISCHQTALRRKKKVCITDCIARNSTKITQMNCLQKLV